MTSLDPDRAYIQVTHVTPYFTEDEMNERETQFERENQLKCFYYETPFTKDGKSHGTVDSQWMRKTFLTSKRWI